MSRGVFCKAVLAAMVVLAFGALAFAAPVAKVGAFPKGEGLEEFLSGIDGSKISRVERASEHHDTAVVIVPLSEGGSIEVYEAELNDNFEVVPKRGNAGDLLAEAPSGHGILFWRVVPEGMPNTVVVVKDAEGKEHFWSPAFSGIDDSLITNDEFIP